MGQTRVIPSPELLGKYIATTYDFIRSGGNSLELETGCIQTAPFQRTA